MFKKFGFMDKKYRSTSFFERYFLTTGKKYPTLILIYTELSNTILMLLLTALPAQQNAAFSKTQGIHLLIFGAVGLLVRNIMLLWLFVRFNPVLMKRLDQITRQGTAADDPDQERRAWEQATSATKHYLTFEFAGSILLALLPLSAYGYFALGLKIEQIIFLSLAALAACFANTILENLTLNRMFEPILEALLPQQYADQLAGIKGMPLWLKLTYLIFALLMISLLLVIPTAFQQVKFISSGPHSLQDLTKTFLTLLNSGVGALVIGMFLSLQLVVYFSAPFRKMTKLFEEIEKGNLDRRISVSLPDEFGSLNINLNQMINQLEVLTTSLEDQVAKRTVQLNQANDELNIELAERKRAQDQLTYTALHDPLTDLPNRVLFLDRLNQAMERAKRQKGYSFAVFFLDLDRFKVVNDSMGHDIGDLLLVENARRLKSCVRSLDTVARQGGDEFVILLEDLESPTEYKIVAERIQRSLDIPADLGGSRVFMSVSMGIVLNSPRYKRADDMLRDADIAMYRAKKLGRNRFEVFKPAMLEGVRTHLEMETNLRKALEKHEFIIYYQPIVNLENQRIVGFEALLRWQQPQKGLTLPEEFISTLEEIGLIVPVGYWVLDQACKQIHIWQEKYPADPPITVSVNLSTRQCTQPDLVQNITRIMKKNQVSASSLKLELTESLVVEDSTLTAAILSQLRKLGIQVQVDDFGTGYSSLAYLHSLPIDTLKIDRTFISQLGTSDSGAEIVRTILSLARSLNISVIAEGVETKEQLAMLSDMQCEFVQGFLFARPVNSQEAATLLGISLKAGRTVN
jgi:diguanylate cyclase (GGDEF)-like protein